MNKKKYIWNKKVGSVLNKRIREYQTEKLCKYIVQGLTTNMSKELKKVYKKGGKRYKEIENFVNIGIYKGDFFELTDHLEDYICYKQILPNINLYKEVWDMKKINKLGKYKEPKSKLPIKFKKGLLYVPTPDEYTEGE